MIAFMWHHSLPKQEMNSVILFSVKSRTIFYSKTVVLILVDCGPVQFKPSKHKNSSLCQFGKHMTDKTTDLCKDFDKAYFVWHVKC